MSSKKLLLLTTAVFGGFAFAGAASAQSTGTIAAESTVDVDEVVVTGQRGPRNIEGAIVAVEAPKSRAVLTQEFIAQQTPGQTILDTINILPSVTFTSNDAFGSAGGDITVRGFDSQRVALLFDGLPLNDTGNYEIYPNQQLDPELIESVTVNLGTTDVDSPTAAAAGGTINYVTLRPDDEFGVRSVLSVGSDDFRRGFLMLNSGEIGPYGTTAFGSISWQRNDIFNGSGQIKKQQLNARIFQDLGGRDDFASLAVNYNRNRNTFIDRITLAEFNAGSEGGNTDEYCAREAPGPGAQDDRRSLPGGARRGDNCFRNATNPSDTGNIRGQFSYGLTDALRFTVDPSFQYTLANGGSAFTYSERDAQLRGNTTAVGVDLNGDGDTLDSVRLFQPNTTNTRRYGVTSSLIWRFAENQSARLAYTFDRGRHRQTGDVGYIDLGGDPEDVFAGKDGYGRRVALPDGTNLRRRDRVSVALLNQIAAEYRGRFIDERLLVNVGLRAPFLKRELNNFCYQQNTFTARCTTETPIDVAGTDDGTGRPLVAFSTAANAPRFGRPRQFEREYEDVLPNVGVSYDFTDNHSVYASYAKTLSAPRTDDLYDQIAVNPLFETANAYDLGYRYQSGTLIAAAAIWYNQFENRIERAFDPETGLAFSANVGEVILNGVDGQIGWEPIDGLKFYASASYINSEIQDSLLPGTFGGAPGFFPTAGKDLPDVAKWQGSLRVDYDWNAFEFGLQYKYTGERFANLINTEEAPSFEVVDADVRYSLDALGGLEDAYLQLNVRNLFDEDYLSSITQGDPVPATGTFGTAQYQPGFPRTFIVSLNLEF